MPLLSILQRSALALAVTHALTIPTHATTIMVDNTLDDGTDCTLREAIETVNAGMDLSNGCGDVDSMDDTIVLPSGTITLTSTLPSVNRDVVINGSITGNGTTIDGNDLVGGLSFTGDTSEINNLTISNCSKNGFGGGVDIQGADVTINNSTIDGNTSDGFGGGINLNSGTLTISNSTISNNLTNSNGGAVHVERGVAHITNSTIVNNMANTYGGGLDLVYLYEGSTIRNSIIIGNRADIGDQISVYLSAAISSDNNLLGDNGATSAQNFDLFTPSVTDINASSDVVGGGFAVAEMINLPLSDNGGPTLTFSLAANSPAIDAGSNNTCLNTDQRLFLRSLTNGDPCDIGAFEDGAMPPQEAAEEICFVSKTTNGNVFTFCL